VGYVVAPGLAQQPLDDHFALCVSALAELVVPDSPLRVGDVDGWPKSVCECLPDCVVTVERDGIPDGHVLHRLAHVANVAFKREFGVWTPTTTNP
jgi:hypothetical protein